MSTKLENNILKLYKDPIPSTRIGALYNAFSYPTKISPEVIAIFIATHTKPGATILDTFSGSGTTGLATLLCEQPTKAMLNIVSKLNLKPNWGPRKAHLYEIGTLGAFISNTMCHPVNPIRFEICANNLIDNVEKEMRSIYEILDPNGEKGEIRYIIWSDILVCSQCKKETSYWDAVVSLIPLKLKTTFRCQYCQNENKVSSSKRATMKQFDQILGKEITVKKRVPAMIYGHTKGKNWSRHSTIDDKKRYEQIFKSKIKDPLIEPVVWGDLYRSGYHTGITHIHHFYTQRNFTVFNALWNRIKNEPREYRDVLRFLLLSYNSTHSTLMSRVVIKQQEKNFIVTGAQSGVLYISSLPVEKNIFIGLKRKISTIKEAFSIVYGSKSTVNVNQKSSTSLNLPDNSIDYVFTDPPFGDYIPYAEINQINEVWLGKKTNRKQEIIVSNSEGRSIKQYGDMMSQVMTEVSRTLKKDGLMTLVFHSAKADVWQALMTAYASAGLGVKASSVLDKVQSSFKQVVSTISVKGDPLLLLDKKSVKKIQSNEDIERDQILKQVFKRTLDESIDIKEHKPERMYSRFITKCLEKGISVKVDAGTFYKLVKSIDKSTK